jgi:hypothetical protein
MAEVRPADPVARRQMLVVLLLAVVLGGAMLAAMPMLGDAMQSWLLAEGADPIERGALLLRGLSLALALAALAPAVYCYVIAARIDAAGEFPLPGAKLVRDTPVLRGDAARSRAWMLRAIAIALALLALAGGILVWVLAGTLMP